MQKNKPGPKGPIIRTDLTGKKVGYLKVIGEGKHIKNKTAPGYIKVWKCRCVCGKIIEVRHSNLQSKNRMTASCGCKRKKTIAKRLRTHGDSRPFNKYYRLYQIWYGMKKRCSSKCCKKDIKYYYDKGVRVCKKWQSYSEFKKWALVNGYRKDLVIDRIDSSKNYQPSNCRWVTPTENTANANRGRIKT